MRKGERDIERKSERGGERRTKKQRQREEKRERQREVERDRDRERRRQREREREREREIQRQRGDTETERDRPLRNFFSYFIVLPIILILSDKVSKNRSLRISPYTNNAPLTTATLLLNLSVWLPK